MSAPADTSLRLGLMSALDAPLRTAYAELGASLTVNTGGELWLEAGFHPLPKLGLFARAFTGSRDTGITAGARLNF